MRHIVLPQALKRALPPLAGQFIDLIKDSSLVSIMALTDLTKAGREIVASTFSPFEMYFTVALMYLVLTGLLSCWCGGWRRGWRMTDVLIRMQGVEKRYANGVVGVRNAALTVKRGEVVCIIGPSGSGKSTLLRTINGLETITAGEIHVDGHAVHARDADLNELRTHAAWCSSSSTCFRT